MRFMLYSVCKTLRLSVINKELFDFLLIWNFVEIESDLISGTELSLFDCSCYASQTKQLSVQGARRSPSTRWYDSLCHTHGFEPYQQSPVTWSETVGLRTRPVWDQKKSVFVFVFILQVWCYFVKHIFTLVVIMILKDTATFQVLFIVSLFCVWNITTVEINSGVHLLKS